jgi:hypothetical protein
MLTMSTRNDVVVMAARLRGRHREAGISLTTCLTLCMVLQLLRILLDQGHHVDKALLGVRLISPSLVGTWLDNTKPRAEDLSIHGRTLVALVRAGILPFEQLIFSRSRDVYVRFLTTAKGSDMAQRMMLV